MEYMSYDDLVKKVWEYLWCVDGHNLIVNLTTCQEMRTFRQQFSSSGIEYLDVSYYCKGEDDPDLHRFCIDLTLTMETVPHPFFFFGFSSLVKLQGSNELEQFFQDFLTGTRAFGNVLVVFRCDEWLRKISDGKYWEWKIYSTEETIAPLPVISFRSPDLPDVNAPNCIRGLPHLPKLLEETEGEQFTVITGRKAEEFPNSLLRIMTDTRL